MIRFPSKNDQNIGIHRFQGPFLEKPVFHIRPSEVSFSLGRGAGGDLGPGGGDLGPGEGFLDSENSFLDLDNWFLESGILKYGVLEHPNWRLGGF